MSCCRAVQVGLIFFLSALVGCAGLRNGDAESAYSLPGDLEPDQGIFSEVSNGMVSRVRSAVGLGLSETAAKDQYAEAMSSYRDAAQRQGTARRKEFDAAGKLFAKAAVRWPNSSVEEDAMFYQA